jgi:hypothetical protein
MTAYALRTDAGWTELVPGLAFTTQDGTQYPANWLDHASTEDITAIGSVAIVEPPAAPDGKVNRLAGLGNVNGAPTRTYELVDAPAIVVPVPVATTKQPATGGITVTSGVIALNPDAVGLSSAIRVSTGRYRIYFDEVQSDANYIPILTVRDVADRRARLSAKATAYVEVKTLDQTGAAADAQEIGIIVNRVSWT